MLQEIHRYMGRTVELIYMDRSGNFSKRAVKLHSVRDGRVRVYCLERNAPRLLKVENILAMAPAVGRAS